MTLYILTTHNLIQNLSLEDIIANLDHFKSIKPDKFTAYTISGLQTK